MKSLAKSPRLSRGEARATLAAATAWLFPVLVIGLVYFSPRHVLSVNTAVTGLVGLGIVLVAARYPDRSLIILIALLPFQGLILSKLWSLGAPTSVVSHLGAWKEALALGVIAAGARNYISTGRRADTVDRLALGFVGLAALYLVLQHTLIPSAPSPWRIRLLGFREDAGMVLLLLGTRHAPLPPGFLARAGRVLIASGAIVGGVAIFEWLNSASWNRFVVNSLRYTRYQIEVLHVNPPNPHDIRFYGTIGGSKIVRPGSVFLNPLVCGFYLVLPFAIALERFVRRTATPWVALSLIVSGAGILLTQTRSAILAALVVAFLAFQPAAGRAAHWRTKLAILAAGLAILAVPTAFATGLTRRFETTSNKQDVSTSGHISGFWGGVHAIEHQPLGHGLGTSAGTGQRFRTQVVTPENNYLQLGVELGVAPMLAFVALTVALVLALRRAARRQPFVAATATWAAMTGLAVGAWLLQDWTDFSVSWTVWGMAGAVLGIASRHQLRAWSAGGTLDPRARRPQSGRTSAALNPPTDSQPRRGIRTRNEPARRA